ncbi:MAG TPA: hydroxymethylglutaryl-CoA lyase [Bacteroidota bacterium]|nr:hydroxymethylglutaryl-CoA lyase [Bacteroidota bacterium]
MSTLHIHEVGLRDGLQMERDVVPTEKKLEWIRRLVASGVGTIQVGSFVHPGKVPQMADTDRLFAALGAPGDRPAGVTLSALVLNEKGLERALACGVDLICAGVSASETHSVKNTGMGTEEAARRIIAIARRATAEGRRVQLSVQSAFGCGYEGRVPPERVLAIAGRYVEAGMRNISLADTAGHANPAAVEALFGALRGLDPQLETACHFHNTYGMGLANAWAAFRAGVTSFESSVAGMGGCPFTKIAGGNVCTEDLVHMFRGMGMCAEIDLPGLVALAAEIAEFFGREMPGTVYRTGTIGAHED